MFPLSWFHPFKWWDFYSLPLRDNSIIQQFQCQKLSCIPSQMSFLNFIPFLIVTPHLSTSLNDFLFPMRVTLLNIWWPDIFYFYRSLSQELHIYRQQTSFFTRRLFINFKLPSSILNSSWTAIFFFFLLNGLKSSTGRLWLFTTKLCSKHIIQDITNIYAFQFKHKAQPNN